LFQDLVNTTEVSTQPEHAPLKGHNFLARICSHSRRRAPWVPFKGACSGWATFSSSCFQRR